MSLSVYTLKFPLRTGIRIIPCANFSLMSIQPFCRKFFNNFAEQFNIPSKNVVRNFVKNIPLLCKTVKVGFFYKMFG